MTTRDLALRAEHLDEAAASLGWAAQLCRRHREDEACLGASTPEHRCGLWAQDAMGVEVPVDEGAHVTSSCYLQPCLHGVERVVDLGTVRNAQTIAAALGEGRAVVTWGDGPYACACYRPISAQYMALVALAEAARVAHARGGLTGVRAWKVDQGSLHSIIRGCAWRARTSEASCLFLEHSAPARDCICGYYALIPAAANELACYIRLDIAVAVGVVEPRGRLVRHDWGWRAERAVIREVWVERSLHPTVKFELYPGVVWHLYDDVTRGWGAALRARRDGSRSPGSR